MQSTKKVDPITLAVVQGTLETTQREMTLTIEKTARSSVLNLAHDYSNALFNWTPEMILQGQDLAIHLGSLMPAVRSISSYFEGDIYPGDIIYHNDPMYGGSHILDCCMYKPIFFEGELIFWAVSKAHLTDMGGPVPASYNPDAKEIYAEGLRIPPIKLWEKGKERKDILNMILTNVRSRRDQAGDLRAQLGAVQVAERNLLRLLKKYGKETIKACIEELLNMSEKQMRKFISNVPDGVYKGQGIVEDAGHGYGDIKIETTVTIQGENMHIALNSPPQIPYFINSYYSNSFSAACLGIMMFTQAPAPYNEGMYRPITFDAGPTASLTNAMEPAPHVNCTTTPSESITDSVRDALEKAMPHRAVASWAHCNGINIAGVDPRKNNEEYVSMILATQVGGAGAIPGVMDGWNAIGPQCDFGGLNSGDIELMEYKYPIVIHRYNLRKDSACAGKWRGGYGTVWEVEPIDHTMSVIAFGEGRKFPPQSALGAFSKLIDKKVAYFEKTDEYGKTEKIIKNGIYEVNPGERFSAYAPGGGAGGNNYERDPEKVLTDVESGLLSIEAAEIEYAVVIDSNTMKINEGQTHLLRKQLMELSTI
ncbi:hydantoinase B/oxoprolinase family protein [Bacillus sp. B190/17]|uniref:Hydantoinase B/oxoprolinase family protein n=1 Tax=Bacillus lumedeiriae TaxID=3058829 RepID=A0ABW8IBC5_9BACI